MLFVFFLILSFALFSRFRVGSGGFRGVPGGSGGSGQVPPFTYTPSIQRVRAVDPILSANCTPDLRLFREEEVTKREIKELEIFVS